MAFTVCIYRKPEGVCSPCIPLVCRQSAVMIKQRKDPEIFRSIKQHAKSLLPGVCLHVIVKWVKCPWWNSSRVKIIDPLFPVAFGHWFLCVPHAESEVSVGKVIVVFVNSILVYQRIWVRWNSSSLKGHHMDIYGGKKSGSCTVNWGQTHPLRTSHMSYFLLLCILKLHCMRQE